MSQTQENLKDAFSGESQANSKYLAFAKQAEKDGYPQIAKLFRAVAEAETIHAHAHLRTLGKVKSTAENLESAISGETYEYKSMYPSMIETAREEGESKAEKSFMFAHAVEKVHADLYQKALENIAESYDVDFNICSICGYTAENNLPDKCPVCGAKPDTFFQVE